MSIVENLKAINKKIESAGRDPGSITLVAVSKQQPRALIDEALLAGQRVFGENRVQEAKERWNGLKVQYPDLRLHLIGPLQTNKAADAVALFDIIQTLDREKLARILMQEMKKQNRNIPCLIQINTGGEEQKSGIAPEDLPQFLKFCVQDCGLEITGLMCIPPVDENPEKHFSLLKKLANENNLKELSMGMSNDFIRAIALGATYIRIGTGVFGARSG